MPARRLRQLAQHLHVHASTAGGRTESADDDSLRLISWAEIQRHQMIEDAWVVINGIVYDITDFIKEESGHPGGADIPMEYAGKDATDFWTDMQCEARQAVTLRHTRDTHHFTCFSRRTACTPPLPHFLRSLRARSGHIQEEIFEAIDSRDPGELSDLGLEALPVIVGRADGEAPASAKGAGFPSTNWAGNILWSASEVALPESVGELQALVAAAAGRVRCVGRSHSFTPAADTGWSASLNDFKKWIHYQ